MTDEDRVETCKLHGVDLFFKFGLPVYQKLFGKSISEEEEEERNDIYIYKTQRYPPKSIPPTAN
jgi:hypothetical protein